VLTGPDGEMWLMRMTRAGDAPHPRLRTVEDIVPWGPTLTECAAAFGDATFHDVGLTGHDAMTCTAPDRSGVPGRWLVRSVWGLVQTVEPDPLGTRRRI
jgi:hypothetical protein